MKLPEGNRRGLFGTIIFHVIVLVLLLILGFYTPLPLPEEQGILVNFGNASTGLGKYEPSRPRHSVPKPVKKEEEVVPPKVKTVSPKSTPAPRQDEGKQEVITQDYEKSAAIDAGKKKREEEAERKRKEELEKERKRQEEIEVERKREETIKAERLRQEKLEQERKRQEELERQRKINEINSRTQNAFGNSSVSGKSDNPGSNSQGVTYPGGNQGSLAGTPNVDNYGPGGGEGNGISYNLSGRTAKSIPKPYYPGNEEGIVVVQVTVNKYGKVVKADPGVRGSTTYDASLLNAAKNAALKAKFNIDENAPAFQQGTITYRFVLD